jgi:uncharacterized membrane protein
VFNGLYRARARQRGGEDEIALLEENGFITHIAEYLIYGVFVFGIGVALTSTPSGGVATWDFSQSWLTLSMLLYLIEIGLLHGVIHRAEREYEALLVKVNAGVDGGAGEGQPVEVGRLEQWERRIRFGWGAFDVLFLVILYLMVFTPGHVRVG